VLGVFGGGFGQDVPQREHRRLQEYDGRRAVLPEDGSVQLVSRILLLPDAVAIKAAPLNNACALYCHVDAFGYPSILYRRGISLRLFVYLLDYSRWGGPSR